MVPLQVMADMAQYSPAELADVSRVYAKLGLAPEGLFEAIAEQTEASLAGADLQDVLRWGRNTCMSTHKYEYDYAMRTMLWDGTGKAPVAMLLPRMELAQPGN